MGSVCVNAIFSHEVNVVQKSEGQNKEKDPNLDQIDSDALPFCIN